MTYDDDMTNCPDKLRQEYEAIKERRKHLKLIRGDKLSKEEELEETRIRS